MFASSPSVNWSDQTLENSYPIANIRRLNFSVRNQYQFVHQSRQIWFLLHHFHNDVTWQLNVFIRTLKKGIWMNYSGTWDPFCKKIIIPEVDTSRFYTSSKSYRENIIKLIKYEKRCGCYHLAWINRTIEIEKNWDICVVLPLLSR